jgi:DNA-binding transcriptional MerR regulator
MDEKGVSIGQLAASSGLSPRALRFYEKRGLLGPVARDAGGRRRYDAADAARIQRIAGLRELGVPLEHVSAVLDDAAALDEFLAAQIRRVDEHIERLQAFRADVSRVVAARATGHTEMRPHPSAAEVAARAHELLTARPGEDDLPGGLPAFGPAATDAIEQEYPRLYARADALRRAGIGPDAPQMQEVVRRMHELSALLSGGRPEVSDAVRALWTDRSADLTGRDYTDLATYVEAARAISRCS